MEDGHHSGKALLFYIILLGVLAIGTSIWLEANRIHQRQQAITLQHGTAFPKAMPLKAFELIDDDNTAFTNKDLEGQWSLLFFGFTNCAMVCPTTMSKLNEAIQILKKTDADQIPRVIFISVDPDRDTPAAIKKYVASFNKTFEGATGSKANLAALTKNLGVMYAKAQKSGEKDYQLNHSSMIIVINPRGKWAGILTPPFDARVMAEDIIRIQQKD